MKKLFYNGTILTMNDMDEMIDYVMVEDGMIIKVGKMDDINLDQFDEFEKINLNKQTMMPAFIDSHSHISLVAQLTTAADLSECSSFEDIIITLQNHQKNNNICEDGIIIGFGYDHNFLPDQKHPTKEILDKVSTSIPIYISHASGHMGCSNEIALKLANITEETQDPSGGLIGRIKDSKVPNGYFEENGMTALQAMIAPRIKFNIVDAMEKAQELYFSYGITTAQDGASTRDNIKMLKNLDKSGVLKIDVISYPMINDEVDNIFKENEDCANKYLNHFKLGGYKAVLDGSPQGKTAWMTEPYENSNGYCAYPWFSDDVVEKFMKKAIQDSQQILVHCNGDAASDQFIQSYKKAIEYSDNPNRKSLRPVMIHCQTVREDQLNSMADIKIIPSLFVGHVYYWGDIHYKNLGEYRANRISPCASAIKKGLKFTLHQDTPVTKPNMLHTIWSAVNRQTRSGRILGRNEACSVTEALKAITINAAYAYFEEDIKGTITIGKVADFVVLDKNPMEVPLSEIKDIKVTNTIKNGEVVYARALL